MASGYDFVPGTVPIENFDRDAIEIILQPVPTDDCNDPLNWSKPRKAVNFILACFYSLFTFTLLDIGPVIWGDLNEELGISYQNLNNSWAIDCAGLALGCVILYPLANKYGRRPIYIASLLVQLAGAIWFAVMKTNWENLVINLIIGLAGAISETIVQMTIADLFFTHQRASVNAVYFLVVCIGTFLAPVAAGYCANTQGWRWIWWWSAILLGINFLAVILFFEETKYIPVLNGTDDSQNIQKEATLTTSAQDKDTKYPTASDPSTSVLPIKHRKSYRQRLSLATPSDTPIFRHTYQPFIVLAKFPPVAYTSLMYGAYLAWFSVCGTTSSTYLLSPPYNFNSTGIGLFSLAPFIGSIIAFFYSGPLADWYILWAAKRNKGLYEPEMRLHLALVCIIITPAGLLLYGLGLAKGLSWAILALGYGLFGFTFTVMCSLSLTYVLDCYQDIVGDALVAVAFVRNGFATAIVFAIAPWTEQQGLYNFFTTIGCLSTVIALSTLLMIWYGKQARRMTAVRYNKYALLQPISRTFTG